MGLLQVMDDAAGYVKATFQGPQGSGKTRTAVELATETHRFFGSTKPIAFFDTETGSDYVAGLIEERTGLKPIRVKTRAFSDLLEVARECLEGASDILIGDSITHVWRELQDAHMRRVNDGRKWPKTRMDIQDIMQVKKQWEPWTDMFLNSPMHIIICGREGAEWGNEENEETGKRDLVQVGKKMKVEGEFGYEASLMIAMSAEQVGGTRVRKRDKSVEKSPRRIVNVATVLKDRFDVMNGQVFEFPTGATFMPYIERLVPSKHGVVDVAVKSDRNMPGMGADPWAKEKHLREELCEEIQGLMLSIYPGQTAAEKKAKSDLLFDILGTRSWTQAESTPSDKLSIAFEKLKASAAK